MSTIDCHLHGPNLKEGPIWLYISGHKRKLTTTSDKIESRKFIHAIQLIRVQRLKML